MEKSKEVAALNAAGEHFGSWIDLCICFGFKYRILNAEIYPVLLIDPTWSSHFDGFGERYRVSEPDQEDVIWIVIHRDDKFDPTLYENIVDAWKFNHKVK
jgi:hypothetical protein